MKKVKERNWAHKQKVRERDRGKGGEREGGEKRKDFSAKEHLTLEAIKSIFYFSI